MYLGEIDFGKLIITTLLQMSKDRGKPKRVYAHSD